MINKFKSFTKLSSGAKETVLCVICCLLLMPISFFVRNYIVCPTLVIGDSMNPTLNDKQIVLTVSKHLCDIERNDIVLLENYNSNTLIKRVVAVPGDTLEIKDNQLIVNGSIVNEDFIKEPMNTQNVPEFTVPEGRYYVLGDNRNDSTDSRNLGLIGENNIDYVVKSTNVLLSVFYFVAFFIVLAVIFWLIHEASCRLLIDYNDD